MFSRNCYDVEFLVICPWCKDTKTVGSTIKCSNPPIYNCLECKREFTRGTLERVLKGE